MPADRQMEVQGKARRFLALIQDHRGYDPPGAPLPPLPPEGPAQPVLFHVVKAEDYERVCELLKGLVEAEDQPCSFDHHGHCQEHGWFGEPGECYTRLAREAVGL